MKRYIGALQALEHENPLVEFGETVPQGHHPCLPEKKANKKLPSPSRILLASSRGVDVTKALWTIKPRLICPARTLVADSWLSRPYSCHA